MDEKTYPAQVPADNEAMASYRFKRYGLDPFAAYYVGVDDSITVRIFSPNVSSTVNISMRYQGVNGEIRPEFYNVVTQSVGATPTIKIIPGSEGYLLSLSVECPGTNRGQCFVVVILQRGQGSGDSTFGRVLLAGYPGAIGAIGFPETPAGSPLDGRGAMRSIGIANPAAGADFAQVVPAGVNWILRSATAQLVTSAGVATRQPSLIVKDGAGNVVLRSAQSQTQAASLTDVFSWFNGALVDAGAPVVNGGLPAEFRALAGWTIASLTANIQAADQWSAIFLAVEEFIAA